MKEYSAEESKEEQFKKKVAVVEKRLDPIGGEMDPGIIDTVAALNLFKIPTSSSCEGHLDHGLANPWIDFEAIDRPEERLIGESAKKNELKEKYGVNIFDDYPDSMPEDAREEYWSWMDDASETDEYKHWVDENKKLAGRVQELIDEFYNDRERGSEYIRNLWPDRAGGRISAGEEENIFDNQDEMVKRTQQEEKELAQRLQVRRTEMANFTDYLKKKFFDGGAI